jgi:hypothetical protein
MRPQYQRFEELGPIINLLTTHHRHGCDASLFGLSHLCNLNEWEEQRGVQRLTERRPLPEASLLHLSLITADRMGWWGTDLSRFIFDEASYTRARGLGTMWVGSLFAGHLSHIFSYVERALSSFHLTFTWHIAESAHLCSSAVSHRSLFSPLFEPALQPNLLSNMSSRTPAVVIGRPANFWLFDPTKASISPTH